MKLQWQSSDGLVHIMVPKYLGPRPECYGPYAPPWDTVLTDDAPTCFQCIYNWTRRPHIREPLLKEGRRR
jgi:hypothetical protein